MSEGHFWPRIQAVHAENAGAVHQRRPPDARRGRAGKRREQARAGRRDGLRLTA